MEEMKHVVMGDKGRWVWMSRKDTDKRFFLEISDYQYFDATNKINGFLSQRSSTSVICKIEFSKKKFPLVVTEEYKFEKWAK